MLIRTVMHKNSLLFALTAALLLVGCMGSAQVRGSASVSAPELVYISPGVQVIVDYHEPVFYSDSYYWRYSGNVWYRSHSHTSGWVRYQAPTAILRIERPSAYIRYRAQGRANAVGQTPQEQRNEIKEERKEQREEAKEERKEQKEAQKEERKEQKEERKEQKEERKEQKEERKDNGNGNGNNGNGNGNNGKKGKT